MIRRLFAWLFRLSGCPTDFQVRVALDGWLGGR